MIQRGVIIQPVDIAIAESSGDIGLAIIDGRFCLAEYRNMRDVPRLTAEDIRELQDIHTVNLCDECDDWFDAESGDGLTIMSDEEFINTFEGGME